MLVDSTNRGKLDRAAESSKGVLRCVTHGGFRCAEDGTRWLCDRQGGTANGTRRKQRIHVLLAEEAEPRIAALRGDLDGIRLVSRLCDFDHAAPHATSSSR